MEPSELEPGDLFIDADKIAWVKDGGADADGVERQTCSLVYFYNGGTWPDALMEAIENNAIGLAIGDVVSQVPIDVPRKPLQWLWHADTIRRAGQA